VKVKLLSHVQLFATPWTVAYQASLSMGFSRQEYWSGLPFPPPGDLPNPGIKPMSPEPPAFPALTGRFFTTKSPRKPPNLTISSGNNFIYSFHFIESGLFPTCPACVFIKSVMPCMHRQILVQGREKQFKTHLDKV